MDIRILAIVSRDIVAAEGHYHRSCYRLYTKEVAKGDVSIDEKDADGDDVEDMYNAAANQSYNELSLFLRKELFDNPQMMTMADLSSRLVDSMNCFGIDQVKEDTKKHIKRKLESEFGGALHIFPDRKGRLIMYPDNMSMCELAKENQSLKAELHTLKGITADDVVAKAAMKIRADIKQQDAPQTWPPEVESEAQHAIVPESTMDFLRYLLTGYNDPGHASQRVQRLLRSFAHDMVYAVTGGQTKPPKHIVLAFTVNSLTGNVELINVLNRLAHSISYSQMEEIDTALCLQKLSLSDRDVALPANIHPGIFTTLAWDNIDHMEETTSGGGTSHRVNGIAVQAQPTNPMPARTMPAVVKAKQRSIDALPPMLPAYNAGQRVGPSQTNSADVDTEAQTRLARQKNLVWVMARSSQQEDQSISSWTGFNIKTRDDVTVIQDNVGYLPTINAPATQMYIVNEVLNQSLSIMQSLNQTKIVCVFDQALYAKAVEITWKHPDKFQNTIITRLGVFHTICTLLCIIGCV